MSWLERLFGEDHRYNSTDIMDKDTNQVDQRMSPGLTGEDDRELREKDGMRQPIPPPQYMGLEAEDDLSDLAKRVATALDQEPELMTLKPWRRLKRVAPSSFRVLYRVHPKSHHRCGLQSGWRKGSRYKSGSSQS